MKRTGILQRVLTVTCILLLHAEVYGQESSFRIEEREKYYFAIEINGVLCGYSTDTYHDSIIDGRRIRYENSDVALKMKVLGAEMDGGFRFRTAIDPLTERAEMISVSVINGESVSQFNTRVYGDTAFFKSPESGVSRTIPLGREVILSSLMRYPHLLKTFRGRDEAP